MADLSAISWTNMEFEKIRHWTSCESDGGRFWINGMELKGYGKVQIASGDIPSSNAFGYTDIRVEPPRNYEDLQDCDCPLFCYDN